MAELLGFVCGLIFLALMGLFLHVLSDGEAFKWPIDDRNFFTGEPRDGDND